MKRIPILLLLVALLVLAGSAGAMSSANYRLDWFTPLTGGGGGGPAGSANFAVNLTVGQTVIGESSSANFRVSLGYWYGAFPPGRTYVPLVLRS